MTVYLKSFSSGKVYKLALQTFLLISALSGCVINPPAPLSVTYMSDPPGAILYEGEKRWGYTPVTLEYALSSSQRKQGLAILKGMHVVWVSGATAKANSISADIKKYGLRQSFTFKRPSEVADREKDEQFGIQTETLRAQREASEAQQLMMLMQQQMQVQQPPAVRPPTSINCITNTINGTVFTNTINGTVFTDCR